MKINFSLDTAIIITLVSVLLFMVGQVFLNATLTPFGGEAIVLNFSIQDKLYFGFLKTINHWLWFLLFIVIIFVVFPTLINELNINQKINSFFKKLNKKLKGNKYTPPIHNSSSAQLNEQAINSRLIILYTIILFLICSVYYLKDLETNTKANSKEIIKNFPAKLLKVEVKDLILKDPYKLLCGQSLCAIVSKNEKGNIILTYVEPKNITVIKEIK